MQARNCTPSKCQGSCRGSSFGWRTATNWHGHEGRILRYVFLPSVLLATLMSALVYLAAYVPPVHLARDEVTTAPVLQGYTDFFCSPGPKSNRCKRLVHEKPGKTVTNG